jgi:hypothetical protein
LTAPTIECKKSSASEAPNPGRHHVGTPGDIISECPGDFIGIRIAALRRVLARIFAKTPLRHPKRGGLQMEVF